ncbi:hypothetical protein [Pseudoalteromonas marina]|uniref:hypothetical protein n=1 Tax=Pseudoalteromonas marina TaxID=267375 RepID=UPI003C4B2523
MESEKELREKAKELGIKSYHNKKIERLKDEIKAKESIDQTVSNKRLTVNTSEDKQDYLKTFKFNFESLRNVAKELGADSIVYRKRKRAFECFKQKKSIEFLSIGMF